MIIDGEKYSVIGNFDTFSTVPDCIVKGPNKVGTGHGEAKFYIANKGAMRDFYGEEGFNVKCIMLKSDLVNYMFAIKNEYMHPSYPYGVKYNKDRKVVKPLSELWQERFDKLASYPEVITFYIQDQYQIDGPRGYVNSSDSGYELFRELSLPLCTFISAFRLKNKFGEEVFYWKLFVDFEAIDMRKSDPLVFTYGKKKEKDILETNQNSKPKKNKDESIRQARIGQGEYREKLIEECPFCPITKINDERLLIASHIKPWAASDDDEKIDPKNGFMFSPMVDKLFDRGFITFTKDRRIHLSPQISPKNYERIGIKDGDFIQALPMDEKRAEYLAFHHVSVFKGIIEE